MKSKSADCITMAYERCPSCNGSGLALNSFSGEPDECGDCDNGYVRSRDAKGKFTSRILKATGASS